MRMLRSIRTILILTALLYIPASKAAQVSVGVAVNFAPPELPVYEQPACPGDGYIWTPGYWGWDGDDYYWVPGTWVMAPEVGFLWTPGYWGWGGSGFIFHEGFWGPQVGFYGGINYGFGYTGHGYEGGRWDHDHFYYNRSVNNVNVTEVHNVYNTTVVNNNTNVTRASYNGGNGGVNARASSQEEAAMRERHVAATSAQNLQVQEARSNPQLKASENHGKPPIAATPKSGAFNDHAAVPAREGGRYIPPAENHEAAPNNSGARPAPAKAVHPKDIPPAERPVAPNTGNAKQDQKYQQQQEKIYKQQDQQRQKLQKQQDAEHQKLQKQQANEAKQQQTEQKHAQQTQKLEQKQTQQQQHMQSHQAPPKSHQAPPPQSHPAPSKPPEPHQN
jgi:WXXGXW repeat (2 copies)